MSLQIAMEITTMSNKISQLLKLNEQNAHNAMYYAINRILTEYSIYITVSPSIDDLMSIEIDLEDLEKDIIDEAN